MAEVGLISAEICALILETLVFGAYVVVFALSIHVLFFSRYSAGSVKSTLKQPMTLVCTSLFLSICTHWVINIVRVFYGFVYMRHGGTLAFYGTLSDWTNLLKTALYVFEVLTGDSVLIYRLYHVYGRNWKICLLPAAAATVGLLCGIGVVVQFSLFNPGTDIFTSACGRWIVGAFTAVLVVNLYSTPLIAVRIWKSHHRVHGSIFGRQTSLLHIMQVIVESAALYTVSSVFTLVLYLSRSNLQFPALEMTSPVIGLVFCLIIVRIHMFGRAHHITAALGAQSDSGAGSRSFPKAASYPMVPFAVKVQHEVDVESGSVMIVEHKNDGLEQKSSDVEMRDEKL